jgi:catechol 2,3-dioxygenase-like lactoylglutathione lyase family enzyme
MRIEPRINLVTLGVSDIGKARRFYENGLGWKTSSASQGDIVFFQLGGIVLALYPSRLLAEDATVEASGSGFRGVTLAHNVRSKEDVAKVLQMVEAAGATIAKPAQDVFWGGHSGYFADPDGHLWEVVWNPHFKMNERGEIQLP